MASKIHEKLTYWERSSVSSRQSTYDPSTSEALLAFNKIKKQSQCLFAAQARIWASPPFEPSISVEQYIVKIIPIIGKFIVVAKHEHLDGFVVEIPKEHAGDTLESLGNIVKRVLTCITDNDPARPLKHAMHDIEKATWQFSVYNTPMFVTTFAPCYDTSHSRYAFGLESTFILFQPEFSFGYHNIPPPNDKRPNNIRAKIRRNFDDHGRHYHREESGVYPVAPLYVKPLLYNDPVYKWW